MRLPSLRLNRMSKTVAVVVTLAVASFTSASRPAAQPVSSDGLNMWLDAVAQHRPGEIDAAVVLAARWTTADLERLLPAVVFHLNSTRSVRPQVVLEPPPAACDSCQASKNERERLSNETASRVHDLERAYIQHLPAPEPLNAFIVRAVALHSDAAMLFLRESAVPLATSPSASPSTNVLRAHGQILRTADGQYVDSASRAPHWYMARALLNFITPEPALNPDTRRWYLAASAFLAASSDFANLSPHLEAAQTLFPDNATVAFDLGWRSEEHATALLQSDVRTLIEAAERTRPRVRGRTSLCRLRYIPCDSGNNPYGIKSERNSLVDAERHFTRATTLDPGLTEAHVRLAHVRTLLGRHAEAEAALQNLPPSSDTDVTFYAALVHGMTLDALGRLDDAAAAYQRALALFPYAQSANLAMSLVERKRGDTARSVEFAKRAIEPAANDTTSFDPFKRYRYGRGRNLHDVWAAWYAALESR